MRIAKRLLGIILMTAIISFFLYEPPSYHAESVTNAGNLRSLGILLYSPADYNKDGAINDLDFNSFSAKKASLFDTVFIMLKLCVKDQEALNYKGSTPVPEGSILSFDNVQSIISYIKIHPELGFDKYFKGGFAASPNTDSSYGGPDTASVTPVQLYKSLLIALGYKENTDFTSANVLTFAASSTVGFKNVSASSVVTYNTLSDIVYESLFLKRKGGEVLSQFIGRNNSYFNDKAIQIGLLSFFPNALPVFKGGSLVVDSYKTQTLTSPAGSGTYTEWEASYTNVKVSETDAWKNTMSQNGWSVDAVYDKITGTGTTAIQDKYYVFSLDTNGKSYFAILTLNEKSGDAHLWLAC